MFITHTIYPKTKQPRNMKKENQPIFDGKAYAIYAEFARKKNKLMKNGLNRRVFNVVEAEHGIDIKLGNDGAITLQPGTYHIRGFSMVTMQASQTPPEIKNGTNYPGYCLVYPKQFEKKDTLTNNLCIGSLTTAPENVPSLFDFVYTCTQKASFCVGHQTGEELNKEVYLSVYEVDKIKSEFHVAARISIMKL
jgi:hypothetical protein